MRKGRPGAPFARQARNHAALRYVKRAMKVSPRLLALLLAMGAFGAGALAVAWLLDDAGDAPPPAAGSPTTAATAMPSPTSAVTGCPVAAAICDFADRVQREFRDGDPRTLVSPKSQYAAEPSGITTAAGQVLRGPTAPRVIAIGCPLTGAGTGASCDEAFSVVLTAAAVGDELAPNARALLGFTRDGDNLPVLTRLVMLPPFDAVVTGGDVPRCDLSGLPEFAACAGTRFAPYRTGPVVPLTPTPTPHPQPGTDPLQGAESVVLQPGEPVGLGYGSVAYTSVGCYACGRPRIPNLFRTYRDSAGQLHTDDLLGPLLASTGGYPNSIAADWERGHFVVLVCARGYCGGEGDPSADALVRVFRSRDGGITWREEPATGLEPAAFLAGFANGEVIVIATQRRGAEYVETHFLWPSLTPLVAPAAAGPAAPIPGRDGALAWRAFDVGGALYDQSGAVLLPGSPGRYLASVLAIGPSWLAQYVPAGAAGETAAVFDGTGRLVRALTGLSFFDLRGQLPSGQLVANVELANPPAPPGASACKQQQPVYAALVNWGTTGTVHPIAEFATCEPNQGHTFVNAIVAREVVRVATGADCLNVRAEPATTAAVHGCFADGVLLYRRFEGVTPAAGWIAVVTPGGESGWVNESFVTR